MISVTAVDRLCEVLGIRLRLVVLGVEFEIDGGHGKLAPILTCMDEHVIHGRYVEIICILFLSKYANTARCNKLKSRGRKPLTCSLAIKRDSVPQRKRGATGIDRDHQ